MNLDVNLMGTIQTRLDLLENLISNSWFRDGMKHLGPGQVIMRLPEEQRNILKELKSSDLENMRFDYIWKK
jgi:hypothetical protein